jgi:3-methyladenine DNA glycosylase AlkD
MTVPEILKELEHYGDPQTKKTYLNNGAKEPLYGVKVAFLKQILKKTKKNHELSLALYQTGNSDAMYLAGLMADEKQITETQLEEWVENAYWYYLSEFAVPWVASETSFGFELGLKWIQSDQEQIAAAGWATLSNYASINLDEDLNIQKYNELLELVGLKIHQSQNRVRHTMNAFVIAVGTYIPQLTKKAIQIAEKIGNVTVDMKGTACKVPSAIQYIQKVTDKNLIGKKRKQARC